MTFGNVTMWGRKPKAYLASSAADIVLFAETHLDQAELDADESRTEVTTAEFKFIASAASLTGRGGTHGGTMARIRRHLECKFFPSAQPHTDYSYIGVRLRGLNLAVIALGLLFRQP